MEIRNIAIIAHVDHGKTTLVDGMLKQTHTFRDNQAEMSQTTILDRNDLERERGITILAKNAAIFYKDVKINIIDTPGHTDFSGEVERVINMADGALLLVDSAEGPLPQTNFVLQKAIERDLAIIVVINKIDRDDAQPREVLAQTENLFLKLARHEGHLDFPVIYTIGREGKAWNHLPENINEEVDLTVLFEQILTTVPVAKSEVNKPFKMLVSNLDYDSYKGVYAIGRVFAGAVNKNQSVVVVNNIGKMVYGKVENIFTNNGLGRVEIESSIPGDIVTITGLPDISIGDTIATREDSQPLPGISISPPTIKINIAPNSSPFAGKESRYSTPKQLEERLNKEKRSNIGLVIEPNSQGNGFIVSGRGELHLAILIENLRREGYEFQVSKPEVIYKTIGGVNCEPFEEVTVEVAQNNIGAVIEEMGYRKGELIDTHTDTKGMTRCVYKTSTRNLIGLRSKLLTKTKGESLYATQLIGYYPKGDDITQTRNGVLVAYETGQATAYAIETAQERGEIFITAGTPVYEGMIIGINKRGEDIDVNICKSKKLSNVHNANADVAVQLNSPLQFSLEQYLDFIGDDELLEVTPKNLRLRKKQLTKIDRVRAERADK